MESVTGMSETFYEIVFTGNSRQVETSSLQSHSGIFILWFLENLLRLVELLLGLNNLWHFVIFMYSSHFHGE
jgi:hypothetical protein